MNKPTFGQLDPETFPAHLRCSKSPIGIHSYLQTPYTCTYCQEEDQNLKQQWEAMRDKKIAVGARTNYQARIQGVALQLLSQFMQANMIRDMGAVMRDANTVKAPLALTEMLDMSLAGAIHFVNELSGLQPSKKFVDLYAQRFDASEPSLIHEPTI